MGSVVREQPGTPAAWKSNNSTIGGELNTSDYATSANYLNTFIA
jgi:O-glycosyl hydrolase